MLLGEHLLRGLGTHHQHATHSEGRGAVIVYGTVAVSPVHLLEPAVPGDGNQLVFVPGRTPAGHDLLDLGSYDVPDLGPDLARRLTQRTRMAFRPN